MLFICCAYWLYLLFEVSKSFAHFQIRIFVIELQNFFTYFVYKSFDRYMYCELSSPSLWFLMKPDFFNAQFYKIIGTTCIVL